MSVLRRRPVDEAAHPADFPDPFVLRVGPGRWYAYATRANGCRVQLLRSADLETWSGPTEALAAVPAWTAADRIWSPSVARIGDVFVMWYAIHKRGSPHQAVSVATAEDPGGPFVDRSREPVVFQTDQGGSIDPSPFVDTDGRRYLLWKSDANAIGRPPALWAQRLSEDGLGLVERPVALLGVDAAWEGPLVEAPSMLLVDGIYHLFYSGNWYRSKRYAIGYATAPSMLGPFEKQTRSAPWLRSDRSVSGPGGQEWTTADDGRTVMAYHGWERGRVGYHKGGRRRLHLAYVDFSGGRPVLAGVPGRDDGLASCR